MIDTTLGVIVGIIQLCIILIQWYHNSKTKKEFRTILSTLHKHASNITSQRSALESASPIMLASVHARIDSDASAVVYDIDEYRRHHWKEEPLGDVQGSS